MDDAQAKLKNSVLEAIDYCFPEEQTNETLKVQDSILQQLRKSRCKLHQLNRDCTSAIQALSGTSKVQAQNLKLLRTELDYFYTRLRSLDKLLST